ncbi:MAG: phosphoribosyltransferase [Candidatus Devosia phytovorans]|uniref:Phosphoribosyltransferase n=1 Tax=Candidatus Devosia phytovorans TaxID=3121372 RepID=A0AAJ6B1Y6_9HYPH|nr:phosphoribosyltransferase [Devosia sp.]WEK06216.1 MAG: phosphoribosyltransferase [Devosia sp.]
MPLLPHQFWQTLDPAGTHDAPREGWSDSYPATLPNGRQLLLPIRVLPGDGQSAVASLIINQASFAVEDALSQGLADLLAPLEPEVIIGVPTLGLPLANNVARRLGHDRMVALGTSRKFWYRDELSAPMSSITSPNQQKTIFLDPRSLPLLEGRRVAVIDDVISSGTSMLAVMTLLTAAGITPVAIGAAMLQGTRWQDGLGAWRDRIVAPLASPRLSKTPSGHWLPEASE